MFKFSHFFLLFLNGVSYSPGWLQIPNVSKDVLELLNLLFRVLGLRQVPPRPVYVVLGTNPRALCMASRYSINQATSLAQLIIFLFFILINITLKKNHITAVGLKKLFYCLNATFKTEY